MVNAFKVNNKATRKMSSEVVLVSFTIEKKKLFVKDPFSKCDPAFGHIY